VKLLVCGNGYLGQATSLVFARAGWEVVSVSRSGSDGSVRCDLSDAEAIRQLSVEQSPDVIVHCASSGGGGVDAYRAVYLEGCRHLIGSFPGVPLLFTSSTSVYAQTDGSWVTEDSPAVPDRETGRILREAEEIVLAGGGLVARLSGIYGPHRSTILKKFLAGEATIEEDGRRFLNLIHRDDAARGILHLVTEFHSSDTKSQIYNLSDSHPLTQLECYAALAERFGLPRPSSAPRDLNRKRGWTNKRVSNDKLHGTGWKPQFPCFLDAVESIARTL
jgi:nucleoside-diphosphate-sugar epimerase